MDNTKPTPLVAISVIIVLLVLAGGFYFFFAPKASAPNTTATSTPTAEVQNIVSYSCDVGTIKATYMNPVDTESPATVSLILSDNRTMSLPQVVSGSGIRYELGANTSGDIVFSSKGDNAFLMEGGKTTFDNCVANTSATNPDGSKTFTDQGHTFSFTYPAVVSVSGGGVGYTTDWMVNATSSGLLLVKVTLPGSFQPKTNFSEAKLTVGTSADPSALSGCLTNAMGGNGVKKSTVIINGVQHTKFVFSDAGAGNVYTTTSYRTIKNNQCYALEYTIHTTNLANYPASAGITAYDQVKVLNILEAIAQSFKLL